MLQESLSHAEIALYDIDSGRLKDSNYVVNAIQVGGYDPCPDGVRYPIDKSTGEDVKSQRFFRKTVIRFE